VPAEAGLLVPPEDAAAFAAALRVVLTDGARRAAMAEAARRAGAALPGWDAVARRAAHVLARVAAGVRA
jgi:glycosyltransferase involved in cell wall biosynthesis